MLALNRSQAIGKLCVMLECDLLLEVRASRTINRDQVARLERLVFAGEPRRDQLEMLMHLNRHVVRGHPSWTALLVRAQTALACEPQARAA
jgi:hypothetical protein